eukprot:scaffold226438_cov20-Tisochrysis_lutea.AAC.1
MKRRRPEEHAMTGQCCARIVTSAPVNSPGCATTSLLVLCKAGWQSLVPSPKGTLPPFLLMLFMCAHPAAFPLDAFMCAHPDAFPLDAAH